MKILLVILLFVPFSAAAQTAKVIALNAADAAEAKELYAQQKAINDKIQALHEKVVKNYLIEIYEYEPFTTLVCGNFDNPCKVTQDKDKSVPKVKGSRTKSGWDYGFQYSEDFSFIVPSEYRQIPEPPSCNSFPFFTIKPASITAY